MNQYILIERIKVQNANAVSGFTWGVPAITHFLGFVHNLSRKLSKSDEFHDITLSGCAVVAHEHHAHIYKDSHNEVRFSQFRTPAYLTKDAGKIKKGGSPSIIEEGKMNMTVSLLIECGGNIGNREDSLMYWLKKTCFLQRLAGGVILEIANITAWKFQNTDNISSFTRKLLPGFVLRDRSSYLENHYQKMLWDNPDAELLDAWLDFASLTQEARPKSDLITKHFQKLIESDPGNEQTVHLESIWQQHIEDPYDEALIPSELKEYFSQLDEQKSNKKLLAQWAAYCQPNEKTDADWHYVPKPEAGYLVPIMVGYKAISQIYEKGKVRGTRDNETDVCFVESVHSIGEWQGVHRLRTQKELQDCVWHYHYEPNWYLCLANSQGSAQEVTADIGSNHSEQIYY